jgi:hypothetical protein
MLYISVRSLSNAGSTLDASYADVSMYIIPFAAEHKKKKDSRRTFSAAPFGIHGGREMSEKGSKRTGKGFGHFCGDDPEPGEVRLVSDEHGDDVWVRVPAQLFDPSFDVAEG